ncbi:MBL fold metallo-hydrolase [Cohnella sp. CBP 2801]|uniref:MBL fold metallo-hydrolase n=2 Tax=Cohnella zeiphila TaxID=2761120 RepID=A0A7X0VUM6_9BACL|nr:MBL fold metallo-hydrolase [Cohnella zeiphila]
MLEVATVILGQKQVVHPVLIWDKQDAVLIDTGFPGQRQTLDEQISGAVGPEGPALTRILISHQDIDHIGSLPELISSRADRPIEVFASELEKPYVEGERRLLRLTAEAIDQAIRSLPDSLPEEARLRFRYALEHPPAAPVDSLLVPGSALPFGGGIDVIATPGHTPGHISFYHRPSQTLVAGDELTVANGQLQGPEHLPALDTETAKRSLAALAEYEIAAVVCYHGGLYRGDANRRIAELFR